MILPFSTTWPERMGDLAGKPNYFVEKTLKSLEDKANYFPVICGNCGWKGMSSLCDLYPIGETGDHTDLICPRCERETVNEWVEIELLNGGYYHQSDIPPKLHTIRKKRKGKAQWEEGRDIHMYINSRTKNAFQFAPTIPCTGTQDVLIKYIPIVDFFENKTTGIQPIVIIDSYILSDETTRILAVNDGFPSVEAFFGWFNADSEGEYDLIHWTDKRY